MSNNSKTVVVTFGRTITNVEEYQARLLLAVPTDATDEQISGFANRVLCNTTEGNECWQLDWEIVNEEEGDEEDEWVAFFEEADEGDTPDVTLALGTDGELAETTAEVI